MLRAGRPAAFLLDQLKHMDIDIGLYRDNGLGVVCNKTAKQVDQMKKEIYRIFRDNSLREQTSS